MSMEQELGRIADALERIEARMAGSVAPPVMEAPKKVATKKKSTKKVEAETPATNEADFGGGAVAPAVEPSMTPDAFLKYANGEILAVKDLKRRSKLVQSLRAMFMNDYGVASVKLIPAEKVDECKVKFETIMGA